jgi:hypothetical protein
VTAARDHGSLWVALVCFTAAALAWCGAGCAPQVVCPLGTYPKRVDTDSSSSWSAGATGSVPERAVKASGTGAGTSSVDYRCHPIKCPPGTALRIARTGPTETVECLPIPALAPPAPPVKP